MTTKVDYNPIYNFHFSFYPTNQPEYWEVFKKLCQKFQKTNYDINAYNLEQLKIRQTLLFISENNWYTATISAPNPDFLAFIYKFTRNLPLPVIFGFDIQTINNICNSLIPSSELIDLIKNLTILLGHDDKVLAYLKKHVNRWIYDQNKISEVLQRKGYLKNGDLIREPKNYFSIYEESRQYISKHDYHQPEILFLEIIDHKVNKENCKENLYFKRLNSSPITAKDILPFWSKSKNSDIVNGNFEEYILCIDEVLKSNNNDNEKRLHEILSKYSPHIEELVNPTHNNFVYYQDGKFIEVENNKIEQSKKDLESLKYGYKNLTTRLSCYCNKGIILDYFPDPVHACRFTNEPAIEKKYQRLWTTLSPSMFVDITKKNKLLIGLDTYKHYRWKLSSRDPDFTQATNHNEIRVQHIACNKIMYLGRTHRIDGFEYFEIDVSRYKEPKVIGNHLYNAIDDIFWSSENLLRINHNLPKIGEGWLSEMRVYELILYSYPDALHHYSPHWLKPQHFDIYIPSLNLAIEYQGKQHYEPVEIFGGENGFINNINRDQKKLEKARRNHVNLAYWKYDELINYDTFYKKIKQIRRKRNG